MTNMTISIPDELYKRMKAFGFIRWSEIARQALEERVGDLEKMEKIASKSKLSVKDANEIGEKIKKSAYRRLMQSR
jgi:predicted CopG family antitoxin